MKYLLLLLTLLSISRAEAQTTSLTFNKRFVECENRWVAFQMNKKDSTYQYGFIYIDSQAGLTLNFEGSFKIGTNNAFVPVYNTNKNGNTNVKVRLQANQVRVALIPGSKFNELQIKPVPDWLKIYRGDTTSVAHLTRWGYIYNGYGESAKALTYLEPAEKINPQFNGLAFELAFAYNALGQYDKAIPILEGALKANPADCNSYQDLAYAQILLNQIDKAADTYKTALENCTTQSTKTEIAFNMAGHYYRTKDKEKFKYWDAEMGKWAAADSKYMAALAKLETELGL